MRGLSPLSGLTAVLLVGRARHGEAPQFRIPPRYPRRGAPALTRQAVADAGAPRANRVTQARRLCRV